MNVRAGRIAAVLLALALGVAGRGAAQTAVPLQVRSLPRVIPGTRVNEGDLPLLFSVPQQPEIMRPRRPIPPLPPEQAARLRRAIDLRASGLPERALDTLLVLDRAVPHHPYVITERARCLAMREAWGDIVNLLRIERSVQHDSLLASNEYVIAFERLARPRDAAVAAIETWIAAPSQGEWAMQVLRRASLPDARVPREALRAAVLANTHRTDLARGLAHLLALGGDPAEAAHVLEAADSRDQHPPLRQWFAEECMATGSSRDSAAAVAALLSLSADTRFEEGMRLGALRRVWDVAGHAPRAALAYSLSQGLRDVPPAHWPPDVLVALARELREGGRTAEARRLLDGLGDTGGRNPEVMLESALAVLREGPPERALGRLDTLAQRWSGGRFALAEAQFFAGRFDSALAGYRRVAADPEAPDAGAALERTYLLEESPGAPELRGIAMLAWQRWRGDATAARAIADSLARTLPRKSAYVAHVALELSDLRAAAGDWTGALAPLAMVNDSLPEDRLAPIARQRTGEAYLHLDQPKQALAAFEECLARFPRAWNAPEVRRRVEKLRRDLRL